MSDDTPDLAHRMVMAVLSVVSNEELSAVNALLQAGELRPLLRAVNDAAGLIEAHKPNGRAPEPKPQPLPGTHDSLMHEADETAQRTEH